MSRAKKSPWLSHSDASGFFLLRNGTDVGKQDDGWLAGAQLAHLVCGSAVGAPNKGGRGGNGRKPAVGDT